LHFFTKMTNLSPAAKKVLYVGNNPKEFKYLDEKKTKNLLRNIICPCLQGGLMISECFCNLSRKKEIVDGEYCESAKNILECEHLTELVQTSSENELRKKFDKYVTNMAVVFYTGLDSINKIYGEKK